MRLLYAVNNLRVCNGVTTVLMNQYDALIQAGFQVDFLQVSDWESPYVDHALSCGSNFYTLPKVDIKIERSTLDFIREVLTKGCYDIVHVNLTDLYAVLILRQAYKAGIKKIIYHSHNTKLIGNGITRVKTYIYDPLCVHYANEYVACSLIAGESIFGKRDFTVLHNTMNAKLYDYNTIWRDEIRKQLGIKDDEIVIGTVGRYAYQKNPLFAFRVFQEAKNRICNLKYVWVGSGGPCEKELMEKIDKSNLRTDFLMVGSQDEAYKWYSAFDIFLLPSLFEGFGNVLIEAQASGLPTITSDKVPLETRITDLIHYLPLNDFNAWVNETISQVVAPKLKRKGYVDKVVLNGFDSATNNDEFLKYYSSLIKS